jgi:hypothetical protein
MSAPIVGFIMETGIAACRSCLRQPRGARIDRILPATIAAEFVCAYCGEPLVPAQVGLLASQRNKREKQKIEL